MSRGILEREDFVLGGFCPGGILSGGGGGGGGGIVLEPSIYTYIYIYWCRNQMSVLSCYFQIYANTVLYGY